MEKSIQTQKVNRKMTMRTGILVQMKKTTTEAITVWSSMNMVTRLPVLRNKRKT